MISLFFSFCLAAFARDSAVVLISDSIPEYQETAQAFADSYQGQVQIFHLEGNKAKAMKITQDLASDPPPAISAIGAKAAYISIQQLPHIPCVYAMVHDPVKYGVVGDKVTCDFGTTISRSHAGSSSCFSTESKEKSVYSSQMPVLLKDRRTPVKSQKEWDMNSTLFASIPTQNCEKK